MIITMIHQVISEGYIRTIQIMWIFVSSKYNSPVIFIFQVNYLRYRCLSHTQGCLQLLINYLYSYTRECAGSLWIPQNMARQLEHFINVLKITTYVNLRKLYKLDKHVIPYMLIYSIVSVKSQITKKCRRQKYSFLDMYIWMTCSIFLFMFE